MKKVILILIVSFIITNNSFAQNLLEALKEAYNNNTELNAERQNLEISDQELKISKGDYLPSASITS